MNLLGAFGGTYAANLIINLILFPLTYYVMKKQYGITLGRKALILPFFVSALLATLLSSVSSESMGSIGFLLYPIASSAALIYYVNSRASKP